MKTKIQQIPEKQKEAIELMGSPRGQYIIGQALAMAVKQLENAPEESREETNINDMKFLGENIFIAGFITHTMLSPDLLDKIKDQLGNNPDKLIEDTELVDAINKEVAALDLTHTSAESPKSK